MLMAAGLGTRLRPLTDNIPKVMVPIADNLPLLEHQVRWLKAQGFKKFVINLHYMPEVITEHFGDGSKLGVEIVYSDERDKLLEVGGGIKKAAPLLSDPFLLVYADHTHFLNFKELIDLHESKGGLGAIILKRSNDPQHGDVVEFDPETNLITKWHNRPHNIHEAADHLRLNCGMDLLSKKILDYIPENVVISLDREIMHKVVEAGEKLYGLPTENPVLDIGNPDKYQYAKEWYQKNIKDHPYE